MYQEQQFAPCLKTALESLRFSSLNLSDPSSLPLVLTELVRPQCAPTGDRMYHKGLVKPLASPAHHSTTMLHPHDIANHQYFFLVVLKCRYYRDALAYQNINMYFEYRDIFRYFSENWIKSKLKKVERNVKPKKQRQKFCQIFEKIGQNFFLILPNLKKKLSQIVFIILSNLKKKIPPFFKTFVESIFFM